MFGKTFAIATAAASLVSAAALPETYTHQIRAANGTAAGNSTASSNKFQQVVYWGQNDAEKDLSQYCQSQEGIDILVLSFINDYGNGKGPSGNFGSCQTSKTCSTLEDHVKTCKAAGKKIYVSLGGAGASGHITSQQDGESLAQELWDSYGNPAFASDKSAVRPMGSQWADGFDIDVESGGSGNSNYKYMLNKLRSLFASDSANTYSISGAPQCPLPEANMGSMMAASQFDQLFIQFYNNDPCSANAYSSGNKKDFNFDQWVDYTNKGASKGAKLYIGLPGGPDGATGDSSGEKYYLKPSQMMSLVNEYKDHASFAGVMLWDAGNSDTVNDNGCHYSGHVRSVLDSGKTC